MQCALHHAHDFFLNHAMSHTENAEIKFYPIKIKHTFLHFNH
jgi:hypothetical protein